MVLVGNEADLSPYAQALTDKLGGDHELFHGQLVAYNLGLLSYNEPDVDVVPIQLAGWLMWALYVHDLADEKFWVLFSG